MMFSRRLFQCLTAGIALIAILMLSAAPAVSRHLQSEGLLAPTANSVAEQMHHQHMEMPGMSHMAMEQGSDGHHYQEQESACGYCELLIHVPLMLWVFSPILLLILSSRREPIRRAVRILYRPPLRACYRPRAPPLSS
ncbi:hypothetical protein TUM12370_16080 [Salmonella enterica subsp. enterica serovar Choleraesuis]|nr:hypothetical protein TUM12370_16080 [Salmonella enterica subsp. enterica serovar Choleraesuis]